MRTRLAQEAGPNSGPDANAFGPVGAREAIFTYPRNSFGMNGRFVYSRVSCTF